MARWVQKPNAKSESKFRVKAGKKNSQDAREHEAVKFISPRLRCPCRRWLPLRLLAVRWWCCWSTNRNLPSSKWGNITRKQLEEKCLLLLVLSEPELIREWIKTKKKTNWPVLNSNIDIKGRRAETGITRLVELNLHIARMRIKKILYERSVIENQGEKKVIFFTEWQGNEKDDEDCDDGGWLGEKERKKKPRWKKDRCIRW